MTLNILVTGAAGFIGARTCEVLLAKGYGVLGVDNLNDAYDPRLKLSRLRRLEQNKSFRFVRADVSDFKKLEKLFISHAPDAVMHLAARAGVRYSIENPFVYLQTNTLGTLNLLELCARRGIKKFVLSSTSSLYASERMPFHETYPVNRPLSPYAASKKGAEALCYTYHHLYGIDTTIFRYFTVYGPAGRPDMSYFIFTRNILEGRPITVFGDGKQTRDFTYVDDIAQGTALGLKKIGFGIFNLGGHERHPLNEMIRLIENFTGRKARILRKPSHPADMRDTWADVSAARRTLRWSPQVGLEEGICRTVEWFGANRALVARLKKAG